LDDVAAIDGDGANRRGHLQHFNEIDADAVGLEAHGYTFRTPALDASAGPRHERVCAKMHHVNRRGL